MPANPVGKLFITAPPYDNSPPVAAGSPVDGGGSLRKERMFPVYEACRRAKPALLGAVPPALKGTLGQSQARPRIRQRSPTALAVVGANATKASGRDCIVGLHEHDPDELRQRRHHPHHRAAGRDGRAARLAYQARGREGRRRHRRGGDRADPPQPAGHLYLTLAGSEDARVKAVIWRSRRGAHRVLPADAAREGPAGARPLRSRRLLRPAREPAASSSPTSALGDGQLLARRSATWSSSTRGAHRPQAPAAGLPAHDRPGQRRGLGRAQGRDPEIRERFAIADIVFVSATVQGASAPDQLIRAVLTLDARPEVEVIVIARGGGSVFDLVAFDDLELCRIVANTARRPWRRSATPRTGPTATPSPTRTRTSPGGRRSDLPDERRRGAAHARCCRADDRGRHRRRAQHRRRARPSSGGDSPVAAHCRSAAPRSRPRARGSRPRRSRSTATASPMLDGARGTIQTACRTAPRTVARSTAPRRSWPSAGRAGRREAAESRRELTRSAAGGIAAAAARAGERGRAIALLDERRSRATGTASSEHSFCARLERKASELRAHDPSERGFALVRDTDGRDCRLSRPPGARREFEIEMHDGRASGRVRMFTTKENG